MKSKAITGLVVSAVLIFSLSAARAEVPGQINYQGFLLDDGGVPVDGDVQVLFMIYDQEIDGTEVWSEGPMTVPAVGGMINVILGETTPLTPALLTGPRWLEVIVEGEYLGPRERIVSSLFAIEAEDADTVDGAEAADLEESAEIDADIAAHASAADAHHAKTASFTELTDTATDAQIPDNITIIKAVAADAAGSADYAAFAGDADTVDGKDSSAFADASYVAALEARIEALEVLLAGVIRNGNNIVYNGVNVHIVNGTGTTDGAANELGNLIVGYNELRGTGDDRTGSHNIVVGKEHNYSSYGGLVVGSTNTISGDYASVSGGRTNTANSDYSSVSGGYGNTASGWDSSVSGGSSNTAGGDYDTVLGDAGAVYVDGTPVH